MINNLLNRLTKVKLRGHGRWSACCPAHDDKSPSLSIKYIDDGRILLHCFSGCPVSDIVQAIEFELQNLFPPDLTKSYKRERVPFPAQDILKCLAHESTVILCAASDILAGNPISKLDYARIELARNRLHEAANYAKN